MRFKALPDFAQLAMARAMVDYLKNAPAHLMLPVQPAKEWLAAFRKLNIKLGADGLPTSTSMANTVEYLESKFGCGDCQRAGLAN